MDNVSALEFHPWFDVLMEAENSNKKDANLVEFIRGELETLEYLEACLELEA